MVTTFRSERHGFEANRTYYLDAAAGIRDLDGIDLAVDPPPDRVVEIGVPQIWRYAQDQLAAFALTGAKYVPNDTSGVIPKLPLTEIAERVSQYDVARRDIVAFRIEWQR